ncbi:hypothetical protein, partial [Aeromonas veronii]|uniref:hypothetical protein n=1 Tax=Aeromonas veronii TaxID=654 RepID=UPI003B9FAC9D
MMNSENQWFRSRGYLHFDSPVKLRKACQIVKSPLNVAQHAREFNFEVQFPIKNQAAFRSSSKTTCG